MKINNSDLDKIFNDHAISIQVHKQKLDEMSSDIKICENRLNEAAIPDGVNLNIEDIGRVNSANIYWNGKTLMAKNKDYDRPLIQMPWQIRMKFFEYLPEFLNKCFKTLKMLEKDV